MSVYRRRRWTAAAVLIIALLGVGKLIAIATGGASPQPRPDAPPGRSSGRGEAAQLAPALERTGVGSGARGATVVRRQGSEARLVVVLLHGWKVAARRDYRAWASHLAREGNTVILPRYQGPNTPPDRVYGNALSGVRSALELVGEPELLVVAGHSAGAALAADYAAGAAEAKLPVPAAVLAIYPGRAILGYAEGIPEVDPSRIDSATRLVVMSSPTDAVVGEQPANDLLSRAVNVPANRRRLVSVTAPQAGDHYAPAGSSAAAQRVFWERLDRLLARVQRSS